MGDVGVQRHCLTLIWPRRSDLEFENIVPAISWKP